MTARAGHSLFDARTSGAWGRERERLAGLAAAPLPATPDVTHATDPALQRAISAQLAASASALFEAPVPEDSAPDVETPLVSVRADPPRSSYAPAAELAAGRSVSIDWALHRRESFRRSDVSFSFPLHALDAQGALVRCCRFGALHASVKGDVTYTSRRRHDFFAAQLGTLHGWLLSLH